MRFFILDPSLYDQGGHNLDYAQIVAREVRENGHQPLVYGNKTYDITTEDVGGHLSVIPHYRYGLRERAGIVTQVKASIYHRVRLLLGEKMLPHFEPLMLRSQSVVKDTIDIIRNAKPNIEDVLFFPTLNWCDIAALCQYSGKNPFLNIHLVIRFDPPKQRKAQVLLKRLSRLRGNVTFWADTPELVEVYQNIFECEIKLIRMPFDLSKSNQPNVDKPYIAYLGEAREDKGFDLLPDIIRLSDDLHLGCDFKVQILSDPNRSLAVFAAIDDLDVNKSSNLYIIHGALSRADYSKFMSHAAAILCLHRPEDYRLRSAGIVTQAVLAGVPLIMRTGECAPLAMLRRNGVLERVCFTTGEAKSTVEAIAKALQVGRSSPAVLDCVELWGAPWDVAKK
jgi:glycosyltransferase involved in cell wall biosynthesis